MKSAATELLVQVIKDFEESYQEFLQVYILDDTPENRAQYIYAAKLIAEADPSDDPVLQTAYVDYLIDEHTQALLDAVRKNRPKK